MDRETFVQNIKSLCELRGLKPTVACRDSGVGVSFINEINRGQTPSVAKVQTLASYLGITTSQLLGEVPLGGIPQARAAPALPEGELSDSEQALVSAYRIATPADRAIIDNIINRYAPADKAENLAESYTIFRNRKN